MNPCVRACLQESRETKGPKGPKKAPATNKAVSPVAINFTDFNLACNSNLQATTITLTNERTFKNSITTYKYYDTNFAQNFTSSFYMVLNRNSSNDSPNYSRVDLSSKKKVFFLQIGDILNEKSDYTNKLYTPNVLTLINEYDEEIPNPSGFFGIFVEAKNIITRDSAPNDRIIKKYEGKKIGNSLFTYVIKCNINMPLRVIATELPRPANQAAILSLALSEVNNANRGYDTILMYNTTSTRNSTIGFYTRSVRKGGAILFYLPLLALYLSATCFLARSPVTLMDGSTKAIDDIQVGDIVRGAFGEQNTVVSLKHGTLGEGKMCKINDEHVTTLNHPHITSDKKIVSCKGATASDGTLLTDQHSEILDAVSDEAYYSIFELKRGRIQPLQIGSQLQNVDGPKEVRTIELLDLPQSTPIYNLAVNGSHTYFVNGYAVTGDMKDTDFDVDTWAPVTMCDTSAPS